MMPTAIVFDLDGTLVDSAPDLHRVAARLFAEHRLDPLDLVTVTSFVGEGIPALIERCFKHAGRPLMGAALVEAVERAKAIYAEAPALLSAPYPGVVDALTRLRASGTAMAVCTNKAEALARAVLDSLDLSRFFNVVVGGDTLTVRKPDPEMLRHTARLLGCSIDEIKYVGDSETDGATAAAAAVPFILFTRGYRNAPLEAIPHSVLLDDFSALTEVLAGMVGSRPSQVRAG